MNNVYLDKGVGNSYIVSCHSGNEIKTPAGVIKIPGTGFQVSGSTLGNNFRGFVWAKEDSGNPGWLDTTLQVSAAPSYPTIGHGADNTSGCEVKDGDATRVLLGALATDSSGNVIDQENFRGVCSWFTRHERNLKAAVGQGGLGATSTWTEVSSASRLKFYTWGYRLQGGFSGWIGHDTMGAIWQLAIGYRREGTSTWEVLELIAKDKVLDTLSPQLASGFASGAVLPQEGWYEMTLLYRNSAGNLTVASDNPAVPGERSHIYSYMLG